MFNQCCCGFPTDLVRLFLLCIASISQTCLILSFCINTSPKCLTVAMDAFIIQIQAVRLTLGAVWKWTISNISKLLASNVGHGIGKTGDCWGQVATDCRSVLELFVQIPWNVLGFHWMFLKSVMIVAKHRWKNYSNMRKQHNSNTIHQMVYGLVTNIFARCHHLAFPDCIIIIITLTHIVLFIQK